jgi:putative transposase
MIKAHKIRLNPTPDQAAYFTRCVGVARFVYNWGVEQWKRQYAAGENPSAYTLKKQFNVVKREQFPFVGAVAKDVAEGAFTNLAAAFKNFFDSHTGKRSGQKMKYPRFKSKKRSKRSFRLNNDKFKVVGHGLYVPRLGWVNMAEQLRFQGKIMGAVVSKEADWWYVAISVEVPQPAQVQFPKQSVGIDLGVETLATLSDGVTFENQKVLRAELVKLKRLNRELARRQKGSQRWLHTKRKLARFHQRIAEKRRDYLHKMTTQISTTYRIIGVEDLHVTGMVKNRRLALSLVDVGMGEIVQQLRYKSACAGGSVQAVDRFFASSKTCFACNSLISALPLGIRRWICPGCGNDNHRDLNAAKNIEREALRLLGLSPAVATSASCSWTGCQT